jgi:cardiolipin synthase
VARFRFPLASLIAVAVALTCVTALAASSAQLSLITEPTNGTGSLVAAIAHAHTSVDMVMYELEDTQVEAALAADARRGVRVRVLLNGGYYGEGFPENQPAYSYLSSHAVQVKWTPKYFALTHQKTFVVDDATAYILTQNLTSQYYSTSRDFGIVDDQPKDVSAIEQTFNADWNGEKVTPSNGADLVWSPGALNSQLSLINSAKHTIDIYNEEMADDQVTAALAAAAHRGVDVKVVMTTSSDWDSAFQQLTEAGVHVRTYAEDASLYIHAKMILVDGSRVFLGSQNFSTTSLDRNRELGIVVSSAPIIASLSRTFNGDYANATPFS